MTLLSPAPAKPQSSFTEGVEFEETFSEPVRARAPRPQAPVNQLSEAEAMVMKTIGRLRAQEDGRLAETLKKMLHEWQADFEERFDKRRAEALAAIAELIAQIPARDVAPAAPATPVAPVAPPVAPLADPSDVLRHAATARDLGRTMRDLLAGVAETCGFALALHHRERDEVVYRYRVASDDEVGVAVRGETLDDGPESSAAHSGEWSTSHRTLRIAGRNVAVHTAQRAITANGMTLGVVTLQHDGAALTDDALATVHKLTVIAAPRLAELRETGSYR
ncbi:MAG TPA: hypothetical protein VM052_08815 [Candidatus Limnocylindrales bacterium]|nr:hypothetical protein [Candidatus Limnocylindrales bacterium]